MRKVVWSMPFRYIVAIFSFIAFIAFLFYAHVAVKALIIAAFVAYLISPAVNWLMDNTRLSRVAAVNIVYFTALIMFVGVPATLTPIFFDEIKIVASDVLELSNEINQTLLKPVEFGGRVFHFDQLGADLDNLLDPVLTPLPEQALSLLETTSVNVLWLLIIIVSVHLFMTGWPRILEGIIEFSQPAHHDDVRELINRLRRVWMGYLRGQIVLMVIVGIAFTIAWLILGIPGALVLGVIAGLFTLVPDVGPFLAAALAVGVALLEGSRWIPLPNYWIAAIVFAVYLILINMKNFLVRPYIIGRSVHMNEGLVFVSIMIATILEGIMGALLVVPVLASVVVIVEYIRRRVLGLPPLDYDVSRQFVSSDHEAQPPQRSIRGAKKKRKKGL